MSLRKSAEMNVSIGLEPEMFRSNRKAQVPDTSGRDLTEPLPKDNGSLVARELVRIELLSLDQLRELWTESFSDRPPMLKTRDVLLRILAWRIQAKAYGGLKPAIARKIRELSAAFARDPHHPLSPTPDLKPGTVLAREWKGVVHRVLVQRDGFVYDEKPFASLTDIARTITGTAWSGPRFFGIEKGVKRAGARAPT